MTDHLTTPAPSASPRLPGTWRLDATRAVTLRPREDGLLRIAHGRVWVTFDGPHRGHANDLGDRVLGAGQQIHVRAGRRIVVESCDRTLPAFFSWDFAPVPVAVRAGRFDAVLQSWEDLQLALALGLRSAWRLVRALAGVGLGALHPRPQGAAC